MLTRLLNRLSGTGEKGEAGRFFSRPPTIETARLLLRPMTRRDAADIYAFCRDPEVARYCLWDAHRSIADSRSYLQAMRLQYAAGEPCSLGIVCKADGHLFGTIGWMSFSAEHGVAELGYSMARERWGQGYMTEALNAVIDLTFDRLPVQRIEAMHDTENPASGRVMARCGMRMEGVLRRRVRYKSRTADVAMYAIVREEREAQRR